MGNKEPTEICMTISFDGEARMAIGTVNDLADTLGGAVDGDCGVRVIRLLALDAEGEPTACDLSRRSSGYDEHDWAHVEVKVTFPDGHSESGWYRIDGRA